jgi:hypothetical protein
MKLTKPEIVFITLFMSLALATLIAIIWFIDTTPNCWDKYQNEETAIMHCEGIHE